LGAGPLRNHYQTLWKVVSGNGQVPSICNDKALVAAIMGILFIVQTFTGLKFWWATSDTISTIIGLVTPVLVWAIPNKRVA
jgi:hypothetical protein